MEEQQGNLRMAIFIERSKDGHGSPGAVAAKPRHSETSHDAGELGQRQRRRMHLETVHPRCRQLLDIVQASDRIAHGIDRHVFFVLIVDVFAIGGLERLFPVFPF
jgi:hypothetical protein